MGEEGMSDRFPFSLTHSGLLEDAPEQREGDVALVRIGDAQFQGATLHELMIAATIGASEAKSREASDQVPAFNRTKLRH
jgi:hypothetical protein